MQCRAVAVETFLLKLTKIWPIVPLDRAETFTAGYPFSFAGKMPRLQVMAAGDGGAPAQSTEYSAVELSQVLDAVVHAPIAPIGLPMLPILTDPATSNFAVGVVVPIPTLGTMSFLGFDEEFSNPSNAFPF